MFTFKTTNTPKKRGLEVSISYNGKPIFSMKARTAANVAKEVKTTKAKIRKVSGK